MSNSIPAAAQARSAKSPNSSVDESVRILSIRRVELACLARHLGRQRRRQAEEADHLAHTRKQVDGLLERSKQQIAQLQGNAPERIAELEKALAQARNEVEAQRRESARLAAEKAQLLAKLTELGNELAGVRTALEKARQEQAGEALASAKAELDVLRRAEARLATEKSGLEQQLARLPELERALAQARNDVEAQRREAARLAADKAQAAGKAAELEQALAAQRKEAAQMVVDQEQLASQGSKAAELEQALIQARRDLDASRQQIDQLSANLEQAAAQVERTAELEQLLTDAASELEARDRQIAELRARGSAATADSPNLSQTLAQLRAQVEEAHLAEIQRLHLDLDALRKGNAKLRLELQQQHGAPGAESEQLLARLASLEADIQKVRKDNDKLHAALTEAEQERGAAVEALEREAGQFNQQRRELEEEVRALRRQVEGGAQAAPPAGPAPVEEPVGGDIVPEPESVEEVGGGDIVSEPESVEEVGAGDIVPEPESVKEVVEEPVPAGVRAEEPADDLDLTDITDGFDFASREAELVALHRQIETDLRFLDMQLRDPQTHRVEPESTDLVGHRSAIDQLLSEVRQARDKLMGKPSSPPVVVAPPKPAQSKPRRSFQGLRRWLKGKE